MKQRVLYLFICLASVAAFLIVPLRAGAIEEAEESLTSPVIITEIQTGGATASDEFVELFNTSDMPVNITGWQVRFNAAGTGGDTTAQLATIGSDEAPVILAPGEYFVLHTASVALPIDVLGQEYVAALSKTDKTIALFARDDELCQMLVRDAVAWEVTPGTTLGEGRAVAVTTAVNTEKLLQRIVDAEGYYVDTNDNAYDFVLAQGSPGSGSSWPRESQGSLSVLQPFAASNCEIPNEPPSEEPPAEEPPTTNPNEGLEPPIITELLPNPGPPLTDADAEFIELYNPNDQPFDLSGYKVEAGVATKYTFTFPEGTVLGSQVYRAFFSADTNVSLSNSAGQVRLQNSEGVVVNETASYSAAENDQAWALLDDLWQWTTTTTPDDANVGSSEEPPVEDPTEPPQNVPSNPNDGLMVPQITELLPNPGSPKTDQQDEYIELYNPNDVPFDLSGYILQTGLTSTYNYTFPADTILPAKTAVAFFSAETGLTLSNSSGQARLLDSSSLVIAETAQYGTAKDDYVWAFIGNSWQWSITPTPNADNILTVAATKTKAATTKKTSSKKTSSGKTKAATSDEEKEGLAAAITNPRDPLHPGVLAAIGVAAVLYGAYEYRHDLANRIRIFRTNREARRALGQSAKGR